MPSQPPTFSPVRVKARTHRPREASRQSTRSMHTGTKDWAAIREFVLVRDEHRCRACGRLVVGRKAHVDHIDGNSRNNPPDGSNWQLLCHRGHSRKTAAEQRGVRWDGMCEERQQRPQVTPGVGGGG